MLHASGLPVRCRRADGFMLRDASCSCEVYPGGNAKIDFTAFSELR